MNEIALSDNLAQIELEINHHKQIAGQSIWEIGRRLNHVKEHDLVHGQFMEWVESIGINYKEAQRMMKISSELPELDNVVQFGSSILYLIATLPDDEKQTQLDRIENGDNPTVRELQEVKRQLKLSQADNERLKVQNENLAEQALSKTEKVVEKEVVREVIPDDYQFFKSNYEASERNNEFYKQQNSELREEMKELERIIKEQQQNKASREELSELEERKQAISFELDSLKKIVEFNESVETFLTTHASLQYSSDFSNLYNNRDLTLSLLDTINRLEKWIDDIKSELPKSEIIEGE
ncbi:DUF3102 domain-containing protein [Streptococcus gallolyticus]|uniref:DUF3102 domain-containing protein n=1 Tax=Streptococcus gallolyticus TaxID=315405 RepID=UPI0001E0EB9C|nr:DUF3102 domain-containing protein [Streptococcus gallolyticus]EFM30254.1 hypothetical protein HMPREF9352_0368 [Streptococcus gallolyticus subsp. gallolyticus TX20005]QBX15918.1 hypothetical protein Javan227_0008 [Streptococcus phage Javan227]QKI01109.1 DUF3102 domain-containing protein [Streptococcus gallolyticus]QWX87180.1 DUF3102 domain-containing protein [Streptococcus gallolyticus subsp. gallolyticus TX20005]